MTFYPSNYSMVFKKNSKRKSWLITIIFSFSLNLKDSRTVTNFFFFFGGGAGAPVREATFKSAQMRPSITMVVFPPQEERAHVAADLSVVPSVRVPLSVCVLGPPLRAVLLAPARH